MISKNGIPKDEHVNLIQNKIAEIEAAQQKLEESKQNLYDILASEMICEKALENINIRTHWWRRLGELADS